MILLRQSRSNNDLVATKEVKQKRTNMLKEMSGGYERTRVQVERIPKALCQNFWDHEVEKWLRSYVCVYCHGVSCVYLLSSIEEIR